jgi:hypothetical protein
MKKINSPIRLGTSTNLINGYNPNWRPGVAYDSGLFGTPDCPLEERDIEIEPNTNGWGLPYITVHDDAAALLSGLFPFTISNPSDGVKEASISAGNLLIGDKDSAAARQQLANTLGVPLEAGYGYALIRYVRFSGEAVHNVSANNIHTHPNPLTPDPSFGVNNDFRQALVKIRPALGDNHHFDPEQLTAKQAQACIDLYGQWGTHFVSKVSVGDTIFQVFSYKADVYATIKKVVAHNDFSGWKAANFAYYTTSAKTGQHGFVDTAGGILSMSNDAAILQSIQKGDWNDPQWSGGNSALTPLLGNGDFNMDSFVAFTDLVPISYQLTTLSIFAEFERRRCLRRVFKGAMIQKFTTAVQPHFEHYCPYDPATVIPPNEVPGLLSTIATPIINTYTPRTDLDELQFVAGSTTTNFVLTSNLLYGSGNATSLPGNNVSILCQEACFETDDSFAILTLTDVAFGSYQVSVAKWYGCVQVACSSRHETILDGLVYQYGPADDSHGRFSVKVGKDIRTVPGYAHLALHKDRLFFAYSFADSILRGMANIPQDIHNPTRQFVTEALGWLAYIIPAGSNDADLLDLRVRSLDGYRMAQNPAYGAFVPLLPATAYQPQINAILNYADAITMQIRDYQAQIEARKQQELLIDVAKTLNENIIQSGQLLSGYVQAAAAQQSDLDGYYAALITQKQAELSQLNNTIAKLQSSLNDQQANVATAVEGYKQGVKDWQTRQAIQFGLDVASNLFTTVTSFAIPAGEIKAVAALGESAQKLQKLLNVLTNAYKLYTSAKTTMDGILHAQDALDTLGDASFDITSNQQWDEMNVNMTAILNTGPAIQAKTDLQQAFGLLLIRGKALTAAKSSANQLAADLYNQQRQQLLSQRQQDRLNALSNSLQPANLPKLDPATLDLAGLTSALVYTRSRALAMLASTFVLQDQALQYQYLQDATAITSFNLLDFKASIVKQTGNTLAAQNRLNAIHLSTTTPIKIEMEVPTAHLIDGNLFIFTIHADNAAFYEYVDVRVQSVNLALDSVSKTDSGKYSVTLEYDGAPFIDRDPQRNPLTFRTPSRQRTYEYTAGTNAPNYTDGGNSWSQDVNAITPFSTWRLSIPNSKMNKGIIFSNTTVKVTLSFVLNARVVDAASLYRRTYRRGEDLAVEELMVEDRPTAAMTAMASPANAPSLQTVVGQMQGRTVLNGWDAVFNFSLEKIQKVINKQYDELKTSTKYGGVIDTTSISQQTKHVKIYKHFQLNYGYPLLSFSATDTTHVQMKINVLSGSITSGSQYDKNPVDWDPPVTADANAYIVATVPIGQVAGIVKGAGNNILSVVLDMATGTFTANNLGVMNDDDKAAFNTALSNYFVNNPVTFIINSLDLTQITTLPDLRPNQFSFKTLITRTYSNQILQLFITTNNRPKLDYSQTFLNNLDEPIPIACDCSLLISSRILFADVLPQSLNQNGWQIQGVDPGDITKAWTGKYTQGSLSGTLDLSALNHSYTPPPPPGGGFTSTTYYTYSVPGGRVSMDVTGMTLTPAGANVQLALSVTKTQQFNEHWKTYYLFGSDEGDHTLSSDYTLTLNANIPVAIAGSGATQSIGLSVQNGNVNIGGHLSGGGPCGCGDDLQAQFNQQLQKQIPSQVTGQLNTNFKDVSIFALKNLLFTNGSLISMNAGNIPGDLLLTGNISGV